jgi:patatin-like phospholipase/acyl hydrolase
LRACDCRLPGEEFLKTCKDLFRPRYNPENLDELLEEKCGNRTLSEALTNVIIPSFDIERQSPVFFSSWEPSLKAALVKDVCRATTAAPTFLPPAYFTVPPTDDKKKKEEKNDHTKKDPQTQAVGEILQFNMIDGGIAVNNPVGASSGLFSSTFYDYKSIFKTYISTNCHNLGYLVWS